MQRLNAEPDDNYRINYRAEGGARYCWQNDGGPRAPRWVFYRCSRDGEPSHPVDAPAGIANPASR